MRLHYIFSLAAALMAALPALASPPTLSADITATQSKATVSATFPASASSTGYQYKYGTLTELSDFARQALADDSDPVAFTMNTYSWKTRPAKGWVESYYDTSSPLSVGQKSQITVTATFTAATTVTWEWSVDSEEGVGFLVFTVDGEDVKQITGQVEFQTVSVDIGAGTHTLAWEYRRTGSTNMGLDLGMMRNIDLRNTTEGAWLDLPATGPTTIENLSPGQDYLVRAYAGTAATTAEMPNDAFSGIRAFSTLPVSLGTLKLDAVTQTTATVSGTADFGDCPVTLQLANLDNEDDFIKALCNKSTWYRKIVIVLPDFRPLGQAV